MKTTITSAAFVRAHGKAPKGYGLWAVQATRSTMAYEADLHGPILYLNGTVAQVKKKLGPGIFAILP